MQYTPLKFEVIWILHLQFASISKNSTSVSALNYVAV